MDVSKHDGSWSGLGKDSTCEARRRCWLSVFAVGVRDLIDGDEPLYPGASSSFGKHWDSCLSAFKIAKKLCRNARRVESWRNHRTAVEAWGFKI